MSSCRSALAALLLPLALGATAQPCSYVGIGRPATAQELAAWDIDVRPDFKGLPAGSGSVARGMAVWEAKCASCHGVFGESNEYFHPIVGGTTAADIASGRVARLTDPAYPGRSTLMKLATVSTLWDYIARAMPWAQPKSLTTEEVYAVTAYILHLGGIVEGDFTLSERNIAEVQRRLPNRNGMSAEHALWPGGGKRRPDVNAIACMKDCRAVTAIVSALPEHARNAHGNLSEQNRLVGAQRGSDTAAAPAAPAPARDASGLALAQQNTCTACHALDAKSIGPSFRDIARKHGGRVDAVTYLATRIKSGGSGVWGTMPMPPQALGEPDAITIARWLAAGAAN